MRSTWPGARSGRRRMTTSPPSPLPVSRVRVRVSSAMVSLLRIASAWKPSTAMSPAGLLLRPSGIDPPAMTEQDLTELETAAPHDDGDELDEDNRLKPQFVDSVVAALEQGDEARVYELVEPLHPADIADLFELLDREQRPRLAAAITDLMTHEVVAELNDHVREDMMEALPPEAVAEIAEQLDTDDAVSL